MARQACSLLLLMVLLANLTGSAWAQLPAAEPAADPPAPVTYKQASAPTGPASLLAIPPISIDPDPLVQWMIDQVQTETVDLYDGSLSGAYPVDTGTGPYTITTRYTPSGEPIHQAVLWAGQHLQDLGLQVEYQNWEDPNYPNVIGTLWGETNPSETVIICAHLDSAAYEDPMLTAPGADDNASGATAVLIAADIMSQYRWGCTLRFALWTGEEQGVLGSWAYAERARARGEQIKAVLNLDMLGWNTPDSPPYMDLESTPEISETIELARLFAGVVEAYDLDLNPEIWASSGGGSDHESFWAFGYNAILAIEDDHDFNPYYHSAGDLLKHLDMGYFTEMVKASIGTLAHMSGCLIPTGLGVLRGQVTEENSHLPIPGTTITAYDPLGRSYTAVTDPAGAYTRTLLAGAYTVTASAYGYLPITVTGVAVLTDTVTTLDLTLSNAPTFTVSGQVVEAGTGIPLAAKVAFQDAPVTVWTDPATGTYEAVLARGPYTMRVTSWQHRLEDRPILVDQDQLQDFALERLPCALVVDDDQNHPDVHSYYTSTLDSLGYSYDLWDERERGAPREEDLLGYPAVIWFTGYSYYTGAITLEDEVALAAYLEQGGNLLLSSEGYLWEAGLTSFGRRYLGVSSFEHWVWTGDSVVGQPGDPIGDGLGPFEIIQPPGWPWFFTAYITATQAAPFAWQTSGLGNTARYAQDPFKTVFTAWPLEGLADLQARRQVIGRTLDWFGVCQCHPPAALDFSWVPLTPVAGESLTLTAAATGTLPITYTWDLGDGITATGEVVLHSYAAPGDFTVTVRAENCATVTASAYHTITVLPACEPVTATNFTWNPLTPVAGEPFTLTAGATGTLPITYSWNFGDGSSATGPVVTHVYTLAGSYTVTLTAANGCGQTIAADTLDVLAPPQQWAVYLPVVLRNNIP